MIGKALFFVAGVYVAQNYKVPEVKQAFKAGEGIIKSEPYKAYYEKMQKFVQQAKEIGPTLIKSN